jgi:WD40 repeat protein
VWLLAQVRWWDVSEGKQLLRLDGHQDYIRSAANSPASTDMWATGAYDHTCRLWDVRTSKVRCVLSGYLPRYCVCTWSFYVVHMASQPRRSSYAASGFHSPHVLLSRRRVCFCLCTFDSLVFICFCLCAIDSLVFVLASSSGRYRQSMFFA